MRKIGKGINIFHLSNIVKKRSNCKILKLKNRDWKNSMNFPRRFSGKNVITLCNKQVEKESFSSGNRP